MSGPLWPHTFGMYRTSGPTRPSLQLQPPAKDWLDAVAVPLLQLSPTGCLLRANAAAQALWPAGGDWAGWLAGLQPLLGAEHALLELPLPAGASANFVQAQARALPEGGWLLTLQPVDTLRAAQEEAANLHEMLDLARDFGRLGLWARDARTLEGTWDRQVLKFRGLPADQPAMSFEDSLRQVAEADRAALDKAFRASLHKPGAYSHRFSLRTVEGGWRRVHSQWIVKTGPDGQPSRAIGLLLDDTEILALAAVSSETESQLALAVDMGRIAIWRHDLQTQRMQYNAHAWAVLDIAPRPEGLHIDEVRAFIHPDDLPSVQASARLALVSDRPSDMEARYRRRDGSWRQVLTRRVVQRDEQGQALAFMGVAIDVTERRDAELALRSAAERVALVTRAAGLGTWEVDLRDESTFWDEQMWVLRGLPPRTNAMSAEERMTMIHPDDKERVQALNQAAMAAQVPAEGEFRILWPDGQVRWLATRSQTLRDEQGQPVSRIGVNWDITDARNAAAMRQEREIARRESAAKSQFMSRMSHELRTPLNAVLGFTQLLLAEEDNADEAMQSRRRRLLHVQSAGQHLLTLINDVLDLTSLDSVELRIALLPVALAPLLQATLPMLDPLLKSHAVSLHAQVPPLTVLADATRLRQVLLNLLTNAIKYNQPGGRVDVSAWHTQAADGGRVHVRIADNGRGMTAEQVQHLFEPFNRLGAESTAVEGSGIGLTIARSLTERMGGSLQVHSQPGSGSVFKLELAAPACQNSAATRETAPVTRSLPANAPLAAATIDQTTTTTAATTTETTTGTPSTSEATSVSTSTARRQVLYIEDNPVNAMIIAELLARRTDLVLHLAADGESGVAQARALLPDLVLLDMQLPDIDGLEVMRRLQAQADTARIPCIALSANAMPDDIESALRAGAADYWTKPLDFRAFLAALDTMFGKPAG